MLTVDVRTIKQKFVIQCPDKYSHDILKFIDAKPDIEGHSCETVYSELKQISGLYSLRLNEDYASEGDLKHLLSDLHTRHFQRSRAEFVSSPLLHAGSFVINGQMIIVIGDKGAGKSTLMAWLANAGTEICGDEHVFLQGSHGLTRPRTLRVKHASLKFLPKEICQIVEKSPAIGDWHDHQVYSVSPEIFGHPWKIRSLPIAAALFLKPNHGGFSHLTPTSVDAATQPILDNTLLPVDDQLGGLIAVRQLLASIPLFELRCGNLDQATSLVYKAVQRLPM